MDSPVVAGCPASSCARIAIVPWGSPIEVFLDPLHRTLDDFCERMTGGWLFGYAVALAQAGYTPSIVLASRTVEGTTHRIHLPTSTPVIVVPAPRVARVEQPGMLRDIERYRRAIAPGLLKVLSPHDAVIVQEYEEPLTDLLVWWGLRHRVPVLATFQGGVPPWQRAPLERLLRGPSLRRLSAFLIGSDDELERVADRDVDRTRLHRVVNPVDVVAWAPQDKAAARRRLGLPDDALVVTWHGRIDVRRKGLDILLESWRHVRAGLAGRDVRLLLVGGGRDDGILRTMINDGNGLADVTWMSEYTSAAEVRTRIAACDLWVSASRHEGFAVAPLEAMASGRPVVLTDVPGAAAVLGGRRDHRSLVAPDDPIGLARAVIAALQAPEWLAEFARAGLRRVAETFSVSAVGAQLAESLTSVGVTPRSRQPRTDF